MLPCCLLLLAAVLTGGVSGQVLNLAFTGCPDPGVVQDFNVTQYLGRWYEVERYDPVFFEMGLSCVQANYSLNDDGSILVRNRGFNKKTGVVSIVYGEATVPDDRDPAKLQVAFNNEQMFSGANYWIFDTDYTNYAVVYSCTDILPPFIHADIVWILGRSPTLPLATLQSIKGQLLGAGLRLTPLKEVPHVGCPYRD